VTRLLIVEDDDAIGMPLEEGLEREGFAVDRVRTARDPLGAAPVDHGHDPDD
jgi:DNA-binding response OmpR family regulator